jgi:hypothetical protein
MFTETVAARTRIPVMTAFEHWTEVLRCPNCGLTGVANLSQPKHVGAAIVIDAMSEGFKTVSSQYCEWPNGCSTASHPVPDGVPFPRFMRGLQA